MKPHSIKKFLKDKKITSDNSQLSPGKKRMLEFLKKNSK